MLLSYTLVFCTLLLLVSEWSYCDQQQFDQPMLARLFASMHRQTEVNVRFEFEPYYFIQLCRSKDLNNFLNPKCNTVDWTEKKDQSTGTSSQICPLKEFNISHSHTHTALYVDSLCLVNKIRMGEQTAQHCYTWCLDRNYGIEWAN